MNTENKPTSVFSRVISWLDAYGLFSLAVFLFAFIPLYPKLPLADLITGYIVRLRLEDTVIAFSALVWGIQVLRKKVDWKTPLTWMITAYLVVGLLSSIFAIVWTKTVPESMPHILKLFLHYGRRIEYFSVFFVFYGAVKKRWQAVVLLGVFCASTFLISAYGWGQKYLYWPVYSTMNREFSKGLRLYLTEHARVQSTFGGHYDFAAYLVMALPIVLLVAVLAKNKWAKLGASITFLAGLWSMMMTSSRSSFLAYILAITIVLAWFIKKKWTVGLARLVVVYAITAAFLFLFGDMRDRFAQVLQGNEAYLAALDSLTQPAKPFVEPPKDGISVDDVAKAAEEAARLAALKPSPSLAPVIIPSDSQPSTENPATLPADVFEDIPDKVIATKSAEGKEIVVVIPRVFSENAHLLGLSAAIRLDTLWPFAIRGFLRNPLFGSGYSTLTKYDIIQFTEAESTDNDFLRTLGETGALGFITFYGTMIVAIVSLFKTAKKKHDDSLMAVAIGFLAITMGLFVNAVYIDVFVSSKVIETYWAVAGVSLAYSQVVKKSDDEKRSVAPVVVARNGKTAAISKKKTTKKKSKKKE